MTDEARPRFDDGDLVTAVVQDATSGDVLMVAHMNEEAWNATLTTGRATFPRTRRLARVPWPILKRTPKQTAIVFDVRGTPRYNPVTCLSRHLS